MMGLGRGCPANLPGRSTLFGLLNLQAWAHSPMLVVSFLSWSRNVGVSTSDEGGCA